MAFKVFSLLRARFFNSASDTAVELGVNAEEQPRLKIDAGGKLSWGAGGSSSVDTTLYRDAENVLKTDDVFKSSGLYVNNVEIDPSGASTDWVLVYKSGKFSAASTIPESALPPIAQDLDDLSDVTIALPADKQVLAYDADLGVWYNESLSTIASDVESIDDLNDVVITSPANGEFLQYNGTNWVNTASVTAEPMGFVDRTQSTISFNNSTKTFSIAPVSTSFEVWCKGKRHIKTTTETTVIPNTSGLYFVYYNNSGVLSNRLGFFEWGDETPVAYIYWNAIDGVKYFFADERHGVVLDWATHEYLHRTRGAAYASGFGIDAYTTTGTGTANSDMQFDLTEGTFFDEDLKVQITHSATPIPNTWEQILEGGAEIPIFYHDGTVWKHTTPTEYAVKQGTLPQYNLLSGSTWTTPDLATHTYGITWVAATNNLNYPIIGILGQKEYANLNKVAEDNWESLILTSLPIVEIRPLYKITYLVSSAFTNTPKAAIRQVIDIRTVGYPATGVSPTPIGDHGALLGLTDDDHTQYVHITSARTISAVHTFSNGLTSNGPISASQLSVAGGSATGLVDVVEAALTSTTPNQTIDSTTATAAKYVIWADDGTNSESTEILAVRRLTTVNHVEYARISTGTSDLATYSVSQSAGNIVLTATPSVENMTFHIFKTIINS